MLTYCTFLFLLLFVFSSFPLSLKHKEGKSIIQCSRDMTARFNMQGNHRDSPSACIQMEGEGERGGKPGRSRGSEEEEEIFLCCKNACRAKHQALKYNNSMFNHSLMKTSNTTETRTRSRNSTEAEKHKDPEKRPQTRENKLEE